MIDFVMLGGAVVAGLLVYAIIGGIVASLLDRAGIESPVLEMGAFIWPLLPLALVFVAAPFVAWLICRPFMAAAGLGAAITNACVAAIVRRKSRLPKARTVTR